MKQANAALIRTIGMRIARISTLMALDITSSLIFF
jgi:hypothetical protein